MTRLRVIRRPVSRRPRIPPFRRAAGAVLEWLSRVFLKALPAEFPPPDSSPPPLAKAAALREGARLSEITDAVADRRIA